jgi:hypothetical protein
MPMIANIKSLPKQPRNTLQAEGDPTLNDFIG